MSLERWALAFTLSVAAIPSVRAGEQLRFGPLPEWVEPIAGAAEAKSGDTLPARIVLSDNQIRFEPGEQSTFSATSIKFQTAQGLQGGNVNFAWRPETDEVTVHKVAIRRGDQVIDVLASGQTFSVLRREQNLEMAMLDGVLTATMFPEGLQVGDVLDVAWTVVSRDPVLGGHGETAIGPLNFPVDRVNVRMQWQAAQPIKLAKTADLPEWKRSRAGGYETVSLSLENIEPLPVPRLAPLRFSMKRFIEASDYRSWADVAALNLPLYEKAAKIPAQGPLRNEVEAIRSASSDPIARTEAALKLVQGRIRYVALAMGQGGLVPADAEQTWARRFGDCKAKTALLLAILGELGIEAEAVAVHSGLGDVVAQRLPAVGAFDHILVRARIAGRDYWLDGTRQGDTTLARLQVPNFGWGLPIKAGAELVRIVPAALTEPESDIVIRMDASKEVHAPVPTDIELTFRGDAAIGTNLALAGVVGDARDRALREFWRRRFDFVEPDSVSMAFDETSGELRLGLKGQATMEWDDGWYHTDETGIGFKADFSRHQGEGTDAPYAVGHPFFTRTRQTIVLPEGFFAPTGKDQNVSETVAGVEYKRTTRFADNTLTIEASQRSVAPEFAATDAPAFQKRLREMADNRVYLRLPVAQRVEGSEELTPKEEAAALIDEGVALSSSGKPEEALSRFTRATELDPANSYAWANRGISLIYNGKLEEATVDLNRAHALEPGSSLVYRGRGIVATRRGDYAKSIAEFSKELELDPKSEFALLQRAVGYMQNARAREALADATRAAELNPNSVGAHGLRFAALMSQSNREEAMRALAAMEAAAGDDPTGLAMTSEMYTRIGDHDKAKALAGRAAAGQPNAAALFARSRSRDAANIDGRLADLDEALRIDPKHMPSRMARANLRRFKDPEGALADAAELIRDDARIADAYLLRANIFKAIGRKDEALQEARALVAAMPEEAFAHVAAGKIYDAFGMRAEALAAINDALVIKPDAFVYLNRSQVRDPADRQGRLADIDAALDLEPGMMPALMLKAELYSSEGDHKRALEIHDEAAKAAPEDVEVLNGRAIALARAGRPDEAASEFARIRAKVSDAMVLNNLCYTKAVANVALEQALDECEESLRIRPDVPAVLDSRGAVLLRLGRLDEAIRDFDRALTLVPGQDSTRYLRAVAKSRKGDAAGAKIDLEKVRATSPNVIPSMAETGFVMAQDP